MTFAEISATYGNYIWTGLTALVTFLSMIVLKKTFIPVTKWLSSTAKGRRNANTILGVIMSAGVAYLFGALCTMLFVLKVHIMFFVCGGLVANYIYVLKERFSDAEKLEMAKAVGEAVHEAHNEVSDTDFPQITAKVREMTTAFKNSEKNVHAQRINSVAVGIVNSVGISQEEIDKVKSSIETLKSEGYDVSAIEAIYNECMADGKITSAEKNIIMQAIEILRQRYGK